MAQKTQPRVIEISWLRYLTMMRIVYDEVRSDSFEPDHIAAISRGGLIFGVRMSLLMNVPLVVIAAENWPEGKKAPEVRFARHSVYTAPSVGGKVLLVDDLTDTGETLVGAKRYLRRKFRLISEIRTATLFHKVTSSVNPDYFGEELHADLDNGLVPWVLKPEENKRIFLGGRHG